MEWKIYGLYDPDDGVIRYVGCTRQKWVSSRLVVHVQSARYPDRRGHNSPRSQWIRGILDAGRRPKSVVLERAFTEADAIAAEKRQIAKLGADRVNQSSGGPGLPDPTPETRVKMAAAQKRAWERRTPEERAAVGERGKASILKAQANAQKVWKGRKHTPESRERMRQAHLGQRPSLETRQKRSESMRAFRRRQREG